MLAQHHHTLAALWTTRNEEELPWLRWNGNDSHHPDPIADPKLRVDYMHTLQKHFRGSAVSLKDKQPCQMCLLFCSSSCFSFFPTSVSFEVLGQLTCLSSGVLWGKWLNGFPPLSSTFVSQSPGSKLCELLTCLTHTPPLCRKGSGMSSLLGYSLGLLPKQVSPSRSLCA